MRTGKSMTCTHNFSVFLLVLAKANSRLSNRLVKPDGKSFQTSFLHLNNRS
jgi:hypothetical protein